MVNNTVNHIQYSKSYNINWRKEYLNYISLCKKKLLTWLKGQFEDPAIIAMSCNADPFFFWCKLVKIQFKELLFKFLCGSNKQCMCVCFNILILHWIWKINRNTHRERERALTWILFPYWCYTLMNKCLYEYQSYLLDCLTLAATSQIRTSTEKHMSKYCNMANLMQYNK